MSLLATTLDIQQLNIRQESLHSANFLKNHST